MHFTRRRAAILGPRLLTALMLVVLAAHSLAPNLHIGAATTTAPEGFALPEFAATWQRTDGPVASGQVARSWTWGPTPGVTLTEQFDQAPNGTRRVQYYDKARMELNEVVTDTTSPWRVTTGLLVNEMVTGRIQVGEAKFIDASPSKQVLAGDGNVAANPTYADFTSLTSSKAADLTGQPASTTLSSQGSKASTGAGVRYTQYVPQTGHNVPDVFWNYMRQTGPVLKADGNTSNDLLFDWVYLMGYPISEPYWCSISIGGKQYTALVQLFQRRTLTYIADLPEGWRVQMGNVGQHYYDWRYGPTANAKATAPTSPQTPTPAPQTAPPQIPQTGSWVGISGTQFVYNGAIVKLKGTNYWLSNAPFSGTWASWDGPKVLEELKKARDLGTNVVRVGIPYDHHDTMDVVWDSDEDMKKVSPWIQRQMTQFLQISSFLGMKVIFVLFEWNDDQPPVGSEGDRQNKTYLQGIVGPFVNDDRVLAWDIHNEPDNYDTWISGKKGKVIDWLRRVTGYVRSIDPRHPVTVGMGNFRNLWESDGQGTILDFVDFASLHCYDVGNLNAQIKEIKAHTSKPILLEEMGWPTSPGAQPPTPGATYDEATQSFVYTHMLDDAKQLDIGGVAQWTLYDYAVGSSSPLANFEEHFGLVRLDGTFKPAAAIFRDNYTARNLPSSTTSNIPLDTADHPIWKP